MHAASLWFSWSMERMAFASRLLVRKIKDHPLTTLVCGSSRFFGVSKRSGRNRPLRKAPCTPVQTSRSWIRIAGDHTRTFYSFSPSLPCPGGRSHPTPQLVYPTRTSGRPYSPRRISQTRSTPILHPSNSPHRSLLPPPSSSPARISSNAA